MNTLLKIDKYLIIGISNKKIIMNVKISNKPLSKKQKQN